MKTATRNTLIAFCAAFGLSFITATATAAPKSTDYRRRSVGNAFPQPYPGNMTVAGNILPEANATRDLGSLSLGYANLYGGNNFCITTVPGANLMCARIGSTNGTLYNSQPTDGAAAVAHTFTVQNAISNATARLFSFSPATAGSGLSAATLDAYIGGQIHQKGNPSLLTCAAGLEGMLSRDVLSGVATGKRTKLCLCTSAGASDYVWQNVVTGTLGTTTTCGSE